MAGIFPDLICVKTGSHAGNKQAPTSPTPYVRTTEAPMNEARRFSELAQFCRRIADHQQDPNVLDALHDLEQDLIQKAKVLERRMRHNIFTWDTSVAAGRRVRA
jgi:hypothetical protein